MSIQAMNKPAYEMDILYHHDQAAERLAAKLENELTKQEPKLELDDFERNCIDALLGHALEGSTAPHPKPEQIAYARLAEDAFKICQPETKPMIRHAQLANYRELLNRTNGHEIPTHHHCIHKEIIGYLHAVTTLAETHRRAKKTHGHASPYSVLITPEGLLKD